MRLIGVLGGMSAASTEIYYRRLNEAAQARFGGLAQAELLIRSVDFAPYEAKLQAGDWAGLGAALAAEARRLEKAGAELLILATNTMHKRAADVAAAVSIPLLHIADATAAAIKEAGLSRPGLMATAYTMEQDFYLGALREAGLAPLVPGPEDRAETNRIVFEELCKNVVTAPSRAAYVAIAERLAQAGADSLILGCTEIGMLLSAENSPLPVFDTAHIHCDRAFEAALSQKDPAS